MSDTDDQKMIVHDPSTLGTAMAEGKSMPHPSVENDAKNDGPRARYGAPRDDFKITGTQSNTQDFVNRLRASSGQKVADDTASTSLWPVDSGGSRAKGK